MASDSGVLANARVGYATGSPQTWKKIENLSNVQVPSLVADDVDTGVYGLAFKRNIPGLKTVEDMSMEFLRDASSVSAPNQNSLFTLNANNTQVWWIVEIHASDDASVDLWEAYEFEGRVGSFSPNAERGDASRLGSVVKFNGTTYARYAPRPSVLG